MQHANRRAATHNSDHVQNLEANVTKRMSEQTMVYVQHTENSWGGGGGGGGDKEAFLFF